MDDAFPASKRERGGVALAFRQAVLPRGASIILVGVSAEQTAYCCTQTLLFHRLPQVQCILRVCNAIVLERQS